MCSIKINKIQIKFQHESQPENQIESQLESSPTNTDVQRTKEAKKEAKNCEFLTESNNINDLDPIFKEERKRQWYAWPYKQSN